MMDVPVQVTQKKKSKALKWIIIINAILWPIAIYLLLSAAQPGELSPGKQAFYTAQEFIKMQLKAPSTAEFQSYSDELVKYGNGTYQVTMDVDAENSFGAKIRSTYVLNLQLRSDNKWYCTYIHEE